MTPIKFFTWAALLLCLAILAAFYFITPLNTYLGFQMLDTSAWIIIALEFGTRFFTATI